jgi:hypothetical protein
LGRLLAFLLVSIALVGGADAASRFKATMKSWKVEAASAEQLLGGGKLDDAEWRRIFSGYASDSRDLAAALGTTTAERRDMSERFQKFAEAADTLAAAGPDARPRLARLRGACKACHDLYAN